MPRLATILALLFVPAATLAQPAPPPATDPIPASAWPARIAPADHPEAKGIIRDISDAVSLAGVRPMTGIRKPNRQDLADAHALLGDAAEHATFEGPGSFFFRTISLDNLDLNKAFAQPPAPNAPKQPDPPAAPHPASPASSPPAYFVFVSAEPSPSDVPRIQRTWFALYPPSTDAARGLALLMPGMLNTPEPVIDLFAKDLRKQGWYVLRMMCQPSRFTETVTFDVRLTDLPASMARIATELTDRVAECAYAVKAASEHALSLHPELKPLPRLAVGMSGGAIILPTVVAIDPAPYTAAVLIAGGADFFTISDLSNYKFLINAVDFHWLPKDPTDKQRADADALYLKDAPLDAYTTAAALKGKPILMIHGDHDGAVPAATGDLLWNRLGQPERWVQTAGHEEVFFKIPSEMDKILAWIDAHTPTRTASQPPKTP